MEQRFRTRIFVDRYLELKFTHTQHRLTTLNNKKKTFTNSKEFKLVAGLLLSAFNNKSRPCYLVNIFIYKTTL